MTDSERTTAAARKLAESVRDALDAIEEVSDGPVGLDHADLFNVGAYWLSSGEVAEARGELAAAIAAERWTDGARLASSLLRLLN